MSIEMRIDLACVSAKLPLVALADVTLQFSDGEVTLRRCAVFEKTGEPPWATLPNIPIEKNGKRTYVPLVDLPRDLKKAVLDKVLAQFARQRDVQRTT
ncbi:MAG TPA: hypothetical protein VIH56_00020 [Candidatus Acidoferrales bacterium]